VECLRADICPLVNIERHADIITDPLDLRVIFSINPRVFDTHPDATVRSFPNIGKTSGGNWTIAADFGEIASNDIRGRQDRAVTADCL
jgi:hypothetical protein